MRYTGEGASFCAGLRTIALGGKSLLQSLLNRCLGQWRHDLETGRVRMQPIIGQILLQHALLIDQRRKVVEINDVVLLAIVLEPFIESENPRLRPLCEEIL